jgi:hypothetical protein
MITCLESILTDESPRGVRVRHYKPDLQSPGDAVRARIIKLPAIHRGCIYFNPVAEVISDHPSQAFFQEVQLRQRQWFKASRTIFGRHVRRRVKDWASDYGPLTKKEKFIDRAVCYTGILLIDGEIIQPHRWKQFEAGLQCATQTTGHST